MDWLLPALGIGAGVVTSLYGSSKAADAVSDSAAQASETQKYMYNQSRSDSAPYRDVGANALYGLAAGSGVEYEGAPGTIEDRYATAFDRFQASPDYNFRMTEGINAIDRSASARGKQLSGQNQKALMGYGQNLASGEWGNYLNRQANLAGIGQTATQGMMNAGSNAAANMGNAQLAGGNARASAYTGGASGINQGINNALYWYGREK